MMGLVESTPKPNLRCCVATVPTKVERRVKAVVRRDRTGCIEVPGNWGCRLLRMRLDAPRPFRPIVGACMRRLRAGIRYGNLRRTDDSSPGTVRIDRRST